MNSSEQSGELMKISRLSALVLFICIMGTSACTQSPQKLVNSSSGAKLLGQAEPGSLVHFTRGKDLLMQRKLAAARAEFESGSLSANWLPERKLCLYALSAVTPTQNEVNWLGITVPFGPKSPILKQFTKLTQGRTGMDVKDGAVILFVDNSPAAASGLKIADKLITIDGCSTSGLTHDEVVFLLRGPINSKANIAISRNGVQYNFAIKRAAIPLTGDTSLDTATEIEAREGVATGLARPFVGGANSAQADYYASQINGTTATGNRARGDLYQEAKQYAKAKAAYEKALQIATQELQIDPFVSENWFRRGVIFRSKGDYASAVKDFDLAYDLGFARSGPLMASLFYAYRALTFSDGGQRDNAIKDYTEYLKIEPRDEIIKARLEESKRQKENSDRQ